MEAMLGNLLASKGYEMFHVGALIYLMITVHNVKTDLSNFKQDAYKRFDALQSDVSRMKGHLKINGRYGE